MKCDLTTAVALAREIEGIAPRFGFHTALTGGCLYKDGERKDIDILFYSHANDGAETDKKGLLKALHTDVGLAVGADFGRVVKSTRGDTTVDLLFPGLGFGGEYPEEVPL
jgi:hypothetical protein